MSFFDEMKESLVSAGKDVSQKAKEVSGVAKLKLDVKSKEDYVEKQYAELGRTYFDAHKDDEENAENEQFKVIKEALAEIERMKTEILNLQDKLCFQQRFYILFCDFGTHNKLPSLTDDCETPLHNTLHCSIFRNFIKIYSVSFLQ